MNRPHCGEKPFRMLGVRLKGREAENEQQLVSHSVGLKVEAN